MSKSSTRVHLASHTKQNVEDSSDRITQNPRRIQPKESDVTHLVKKKKKWVRICHHRFLLRATSALLGKNPMRRPAEFWYANTKPPMRPIKPSVTIYGPRMSGLITARIIFDTNSQLRSETLTPRQEEERGRICDRRGIADGDEEEAEVVESVEVGDGLVLVKGWLRSNTGTSGFTDAIISVFISLYHL